MLCPAAGHAQALQRWLVLGGDPNALDRHSGRGTLLHAAAQADQAECIAVRPGEQQSERLCCVVSTGCRAGFLLAAVIHRSWLLTGAASFAQPTACRCACSATTHPAGPDQGGCTGERGHQAARLCAACCRRPQVGPERSSPAVWVSGWKGCACYGVRGQAARVWIPAADSSRIKRQA